MIDFKKLWLAVAMGLGAGLLATIAGADGILTLVVIVFGALVAWFVTRKKKDGGTFKHDGF